jgi:predicted benzoate:H+ symporter BenE
MVFTMMPCKIASPTFAVTAAIVGGIALAFTTCQAKAAFIELFTDQAEVREPSLLHHQSPHRGTTIPNPLP